MAGEYKLRTIKEEAVFSESKKKLGHSARRLDEILQGVIWVLSRRPESFDNVPGMRLHLAKTDPLPDSPGFYIWYTFDDDSVNLLYIEAIAKAE